MASGKGRAGQGRMAPTGIALFDLADRRLQWLGTRQGLLARNVANADTPGWKGQDLKPFAEVLAGATHAPAGSAATGPSQTDPRHLPGTALKIADAKTLQGERAPDGNQVSLDEQMEKIAQTDTDHEAVTAIYRKYLGMFRMALGR